jgi:hypothetical protein
MLRLRVAVLGCLVSIATSAGFAADVSGTWEARIPSPFGILDYTFELQGEGETVTGVAGWGARRGAIRDGRLTGNVISFAEVLDFGGRSFRLDYSGEVVGDEIRFIRNAGGRSGVFVARRVGGGGSGEAIAGKVVASPRFPFQDPALPAEQRIDDLLSLLTPDEKRLCLGPRARVPRLGIEGTGHVLGLHGLSLGGPGGHGRPGEAVPTTAFPQAIGLAETWDPDLARAVGTIVGHEARYALQSWQYGRGGLMVRVPAASVRGGPGHAAGEASFGEDPVLAGRMLEAFVSGLLGDDDRYWQAARLPTRSSRKRSSTRPCATWSGRGSAWVFSMFHDATPTTRSGRARSPGSATRTSGSPVSWPGSRSSS